MIKNLFGSKLGFIRYCWYLFLYYANNAIGNRSRVPSRVDRFVFVCKGNICRSPFAEEIFKMLSPFECTSFGLDTTSGKSAHKPIIHLAGEIGVDLSQHRTVSWCHFIPKEFDFYVCVEPGHVDFLCRLMPDAKTILLGEFTQRPQPYFHDPYNTSDQYRKKCLKQISQAVSNLVEINGLGRN